ncbi:MAG: hypothetical protein GY951_16030 [Psychromonas sp.]|nr:hypothetical protein [Psychromonas sp.]
MMKIVLLVTTLSIGLNCYAAATSDNVNLTMLRGFNATASKGFYFTINGVVPNPKECVNSSMVRADSTEIADFDQQFSMLLAAFMAGKSVKVQIDTESCSSTYPKFVNVMVYK